jgi:KOW motif
VLEHAKGDKVRIKDGPFAGQRGTLLRKDSSQWRVSLTNERKEISIGEEHLTNFSLGARRAWQSMPHRKVGRPLGSKVSDRLSVIFRVDRALWNEFLAAEEVGLIGDRTSVINECLRSVLQAARRLRTKAS